MDQGMSVGQRQVTDESHRHRYCFLEISPASQQEISKEIGVLCFQMYCKKVSGNIGVLF